MLFRDGPVQGRRRFFPRGYFGGAAGDRRRARVTYAHAVPHACVTASRARHVRVEKLPVRRAAVALWAWDATDQWALGRPKEDPAALAAAQLYWAPMSNTRMGGPPLRRGSRSSVLCRETLCLVSERREVPPTGLGGWPHSAAEGPAGWPTRYIALHATEFSETLCNPSRSSPTRHRASQARLRAPRRVSEL